VLEAARGQIRLKEEKRSRMQRPQQGMCQRCAHRRVAHFGPKFSPSVRSPATEFSALGASNDAQSTGYKGGTPPSDNPWHSS